MVVSISHKISSFSKINEQCLFEDLEMLLRQPMGDIWPAVFNVSKCMFALEG